MISFEYSREILLNQIVIVRREYFRLKAEIAELDPQLPIGSYIGTYRSNYEYTYHTLGNKNAVLPRFTKNEVPTKKLHLGRVHNPRYRRALLEIEKLRITQIKVETLSGIANNLASLKSMWRRIRKPKGDRISGEILPVQLSKKDKDGISFVDFIKDLQANSDFIYPGSTYDKN